MTSAALAALLCLAACGSSGPTDADIAQSMLMLLTMGQRRRAISRRR